MLRFKASHIKWPTSRSGTPPRDNRSRRRRCRGISLVELLIVMAMIGVVVAAALPQLSASQRLVRSAAIPRQMMVELRMARQQAMTQRQAFTVQYDDLNKQLVVINHHAAGAALLGDSSYPHTTGSTQDRAISLSGSGVDPAEITYGIPGVLPGGAKGALDDGLTLTPLTNSQLNLTFQPDGSIVDETGSPANKALFLYNNQAPTETPFAISILGAAGRVKVWRYSSSAKKFVE